MIKKVLAATTAFTLAVSTVAYAASPTVFPHGISANANIVTGSGVSQGTVGETATTAAGAVQANGGDASKTVVTPTGDTASQALADVAAQATGSVQKTAIGAANGVAPLDANQMMSAPVSGNVSPANIQSTTPIYQTTAIGICPSSQYVGGSRFGAGYAVGDRIRVQDGSIITVTGVKDYSVGDTQYKSGIDTFDLTYGAFNSYDLNGNDAWSNWTSMIDKPWLNSNNQPVTTFACFAITGTTLLNIPLSSDITKTSNLSNYQFDPKMMGVLFDGSAADGANLQKFVDTIKPNTFKVGGSWPANFVLNKSNINNSMLIDATSVDGTAMAADGISDADTYLSFFNGTYDIQRTDNTAGISQTGVMQVRRTLNTPNQTAYYSSGEYLDTPIFEVIGNDTGTTGQLKGMNVTVNSTVSKGYPAQEQLYAGGGTFSGKSGHWVYNGGFTDTTHEPASQSSWENTGFEFNMYASGLDCARCVYDPVDHAGRQIFVAEVHNYTTPAWSPSVSYTAKYDYYGVQCQAPGANSVCMMYNPDHSSHISGIVTTTSTVTLNNETVNNSWLSVWLKEPVNLNTDYDTVVVSGDGIPEQTVTKWTNSGTGTVLSLSSATTSASSTANVTLTITHRTPYIFRAVAPNGDNLKSSKMDYVAQSGATEPDWSTHLDGAPFPEQTNAAGGAVAGSVWWQLASEDTFGVGSAFSLPGQSRQFYDVGWGTTARFDDAAIDISGAQYRNSDGKSAQMRFNDRVPAIDFTAAMDSDETITGNGMLGAGPEQYKNNHTLGYDGSMSALSYKVRGADMLHVDDAGNFVAQGSLRASTSLYLGAMSKTAILALTSPTEGQKVYDTDDHAEVTYRCPTTTTCGWFPVQYGTALSN